MSKTETYRVNCPRCRKDGFAVWTVTERPRHQRDLQSLSEGFKSIERSEDTPPELYCSDCGISVAATMQYSGKFTQV